MNDRRCCPDCGDFESERVHTEWFNDGMEEVRICGSCDTQYTNRLYLHEQESFKYDDE